MNCTHTLKRTIAGVLLSGGLAVAGFGLAVGTAQAQRSCAASSLAPKPALEPGMG